MLIPIVNLEDEIIDHIERSTATENSIYRVSALWLRNSQGKILLAQRSLTKAKHPGLWGPAVSGTLEKGETYESNIIKEASEEIGLKEFAMTLGPKIFIREDWTFFLQWFLTTIDHTVEDFVLQEEEVERVKWFLPNEIREMIQQSPESFVPSMKSWPKEFFS